MKRVYHSAKFRRHNKRHARKHFLRRAAHDAWLVQKRKEEQGIPRAEVKEGRRLNTLWDYEKVKAPDKFAFLSDPDGVAEFIAILDDKFKKKQKVFILLQDVVLIDYGAIVVLLSILVKFKSNKIPFNGTFPRAPEIRAHLERSGFFQSLYQKFKKEDRYNLATQAPNYIHTHAWKDVDSVLSSTLITAASKTIWQEPRRCQGVQRSLVELMMNTNNHAKIGEIGEKHWWLSVNHSPQDKTVFFSFVDFGVGVFESLKHKQTGSKFYNWSARLAKRVSYGNNSELLRLILDGTLHETVTNKAWRGKGLPGLAEALNRNCISNLHVITNNVYANVAEDRFHLLKHSFSGTFVYFELGETNESCK